MNHPPPGTVQFPESELPPTAVGAPRSERQPAHAEERPVAADPAGEHRADAPPRTDGMTQPSVSQADSTRVAGDPAHARRLPVPRAPCAR
ncbi:hypothetical protein ACFVY4_10045 [Streptomyces sp. NPDC058299]|uniref:hypothetical protein n=1 Tax=Streptomyces sp. NPDC058299 TaxID=3346435 RepID=UPI0036E574B7